MGSDSFLLSVREVATLLGISVSSVWRRAKDGALPVPVKIGGSTRFRRDELLAAVDLLQESPEARHQKQTVTNVARAATMVGRAKDTVR